MYRLLIALVCALFVLAFPYAQQPPFGQTAIPPTELRPFSIAGGGTINGTVLFSPDSTYDIGASGATRPRNGYFGQGVTATTLTGASTFTRTAVASADYTVLSSDMVIAVTSLNATTVATITLPSPTTADLGKVYIVKDESNLLNAGVNSIYVSGTIKQIVGTQAMVGVFATSRYIAGGPSGSRSWFAW